MKTETTQAAADFKATLTVKELVAFEAAWQSSRGNGHDFGYTEDIVDACKRNGISYQAAGALITSLQKKGAFSYVDGIGIKNDSGTFHQFCLTETLTGRDVRDFDPLARGQE